MKTSTKPRSKYLFDIETDGLLDEMTVIHSIVLEDVDTGEVVSCADQPGHTSIDEAVRLLSEAEEIIGHNIISFDIPAIQKIYPDFEPKAYHDTLVAAGLIHPDVETNDYKRKNFPRELIGSQSLEAWGYRLGVLKGKFGKQTDWSKWSPAMQRYCVQDVVVTRVLYQQLLKANWPEQSMKLEHDFAYLMHLQEVNGFGFNEEKAAELFAELTSKQEAITRSLRKVFEPRVETMKKPQYYYDPETSNRFRIKGDCKDKKMYKRLEEGPKMVKHHPFKPSSRPQCAERLQELGWKPDEFTDSGQPKVDDETLARCDIPQAKELREFYVIHKVLGMLGNGKNAWLKMVRDGKIHGRVIPYGTVTGRCSHTKPNIAQTPSVATRKLDNGDEELVWGEEGGWSTDCRALFGPTREGWVQVGADASGLELRCMGHFLHPFDGGHYGELAAGLAGDIHVANRDTFGLEPSKAGRGKAKTAIYCLVYGGGDEKLGMSLGPLLAKHEKRALSGKIPAWAIRSMERKGPVTRERKVNWLRGRYARDRIFKGLKGFEDLSEAVLAAVDRRKFLVGLDRRRLRVRKKHAALNVVFQSAGALLVKLATVYMYQILRERGYKIGEDWALMAHIHDEVQCEARTVEIARVVGQAFVEGLQKAGKQFGFRCQLDGEYQIGQDWAETH